MTDPASIPTTTLLAMLRLLREKCHYGFDDCDRSVIAEIGRRVILAEQIVQAERLDISKSSDDRRSFAKSMTTADLSAFISSNVLHPENERNELGYEEHLAVEEALRRLMSPGQIKPADAPVICDTTREADVPALIMTRHDTAGMP